MLAPNRNQGTGYARPVRARRRKRVGVATPAGAGLNQPGAPKPAVAPARPAAPHMPAPVAQPAYVGAPASSAGADIRATAQQQLMQAQGGYREAAYRAAMQLGDPAAWAKMQADPQFKGYKFAVDPNSIFSTLARQEKEGLTGIDDTSNQNNAFFGGFRLTDRNNLSADVARDRLGGTTEYQNQLKDFAAALASAQGQYGSDMRDATRADTEAATAREPTDRTPAPAARSNAGAQRAASARQKASASASESKAVSRAKAKARRKKKR